MRRILKTASCRGLHSSEEWLWNPLFSLVFFFLSLSQSPFFFSSPYIVSFFIVYLSNMLLYAEHRTCTAVELCFSNFSFCPSSFFFFCLLFPFSIETLSFLFFFFFFVNLFLSFYLRSVSWAPSSGSSSRFKATPQVQYSGVNGCGKGRGRSGELKKKVSHFSFFFSLNCHVSFFFFALFWNVDTKHHMGAYFSFLFFFSELSFKLLFTISLFCTLLSLLLPLFFFFGYSNSNVNKRWYIHVYSLRRLQPVFYRNVVCKKKKLFFF